MAQDCNLHEGIYCWNDIEAALASITREGSSERRKCIGIIEGWLNYKDGNKMSFKARSTQLLGIFAPWDEEIHLPFELGAEDTLAFRLPPHQVGAPIRWFRQLFNIDGTRYSKSPIRQMIDSGDWPTPLTDSMRNECANVAEYNAQSLNEEDQIEQKELYIRMFKEPTEYDKYGIGLGLVQPTFTIDGTLPLCLRYLQDAQSKEVKATEGIWRLWDPPKDVDRASVLCASSQRKSQMDEITRIHHNVTNSLAERISGERNPIDETLESQIQKEKGRGKHKGADDKSGFSGGKPGSSTDQLERQRSRSNNQVFTPPRKRKAGLPDSPASIDRLAKTHWVSYSSKMKKHRDADLPGRFCNIRGVEYLDLSDLLECLTFDMEDYSPILQHQNDGSLKYVLVIPYNAKWLPRDDKGQERPDGRKVSFNPVIAWVEDRWVLVRRMAGDYFCQVLFYHVSTFIWKKNDLSPDEVFTSDKILFFARFLT